MKKITLLLSFLAIQASAQSFPDPYCAISQEDGVEEITMVQFDDIQIENDNFDDILLDYTETVVDVQPGEIYTLTAQGNTYEDYTNEYMAFIDWNQNGVLDDDGEVYNLGFIFDSTGYDDKLVSLDIAVPDDALLGVTRIRVLKIWAEPEWEIYSIVDPCNLLIDFWGDIEPSLGQVLDFSLNVSELGRKSMDKNLLSVYPNPASDKINIRYASPITEIKIYNVLGQEVLSKNINQEDFQLNVDHLVPATYIVQLLSNEEQHTFKLLKK